MTLDEWMGYRRLLARRIDISRLGRICIMTEQEAWQADARELGKAVALRRWEEREAPGVLAAMARGEG